jgi:transposase
MESKPVSDRLVGVDVSKSWVDVHVTPDGTAFCCGSDAEGLSELVKRLKTLGPALAVLEASGSYASAVAVSLAEAGMPVAIVNPRQVRKSPKPSASSPRPT